MSRASFSAPPGARCAWKTPRTRRIFCMIRCCSDWGMECSGSSRNLLEPVAKLWNSQVCSVQHLHRNFIMCQTLGIKGSEINKTTVPTRVLNMGEWQRHRQIPLIVRGRARREDCPGCAASPERCLTDLHTKSGVDKDQCYQQQYKPQWSSQEGFKNITQT